MCADSPHSLTLYSVWLSLAGVATILKKRVCVRQTYLGSSQQTVGGTLACYSGLSVCRSVSVQVSSGALSPPQKKSQWCDTAFLPSLPIVTSAHLNEHRSSCGSADVPEGQLLSARIVQKVRLLVTKRAQITYRSFDGTAL